MSEISGCQENRDVRNIWMSGKSGCQKYLGVRKIGVPGKSGCQENRGVRKIGVSDLGIQNFTHLEAFFEASRNLI
jgi:hypothetical protein